MIFSRRRRPFENEVLAWVALSRRFAAPLSALGFSHGRHRPRGFGDIGAECEHFARTAIAVARRKLQGAKINAGFKNPIDQTDALGTTLGLQSMFFGNRHGCSLMNPSFALCWSCSARIPAPDVAPASVSRRSIEFKGGLPAPEHNRGKRCSRTGEPCWICGRRLHPSYFRAITSSLSEADPPPVCNPVRILGSGRRAIVSSAINRCRF